MNRIRFSSCVQSTLVVCGDILLQLPACVVCILETHVLDFASLPGDQLSVMKHSLPDIAGHSVLSGDANVWWLEFHLGRERPRDQLIVPCIRELFEGWRDMVFIFGIEPFIVHQGDGCCTLSPSCCPALGSNHFPCHFSFPRLACLHASGPADTSSCPRGPNTSCRIFLGCCSARVFFKGCHWVPTAMCQGVHDLLRSLWDTTRLKKRARLIHPRQTPMHRRQSQAAWNWHSIEAEEWHQQSKVLTIV